MIGPLFFENSYYTYRTATGTVAMSSMYSMFHPAVGSYCKTTVGDSAGYVVKETKQTASEQYGRATLRVEKVFHTGSERPRVLCLGMVYSDEFSANRGQEFRDRVRLEFLESLGYTSRSHYQLTTCLLAHSVGYDAYSLDDKHDENYRCIIGKHCQANFADTRRMHMSINTAWGDNVSFDYIILDYFFSPAGWARTRWSDNFFRETIPSFASKKVLNVGGQLWLPNLQCVRDSIAEFDTEVYQYYKVELSAHPDSNPLYVASDNARSELLKCPDKLINETQMAPLWKESNTPFYVLTVKDPNGIDPTNMRSRGVADDSIRTPFDELSMEEKILLGMQYFSYSFILSLVSS